MHSRRARRGLLPLFPRFWYDNDMTNQSKRWIITLAVIVVVAIAIGFLFWHPGSTPQGGSNASSTATNTSAGAVTSTFSAGVPANTNPVGAAGTAAPVKKPVQKTPSGNNVPIVAPAPITIDLITPISGNVWTIGGQNSIAWSAPANITGEIDLVNAATKEFVGVILSETGPNQTSYSWDARSIYLARYSPDQKDVVPGTYAIRIHFDGNGLGDLVSSPITITN